MAKEPTNARSRFAQRLRAVRIPRGYKTARSFAHALGIDENRYTRYERAEVEPDLQLLMRICELLRATPNDLLCDTIGAPRAAEPQPYGFADGALATYQADTRAAYQAEPPARSTAKDAEPAGEERKAVEWQLAETIALAKARQQRGSAEDLPVIEKLRLIGPLFARLNADPFTFLASIPAELNDVVITAEDEQRIGELSEKLVVLHGS